MLSLSLGVQTQINQWAQAFEDTFDREYPPDSGFLSRQELEQFEATGRSLAAVIQAEPGPIFLVSNRSTGGLRDWGMACAWILMKAVEQQ
jgi:hypothetical protein